MRQSVMSRVALLACALLVACPAQEPLLPDEPPGTNDGGSDGGAHGKDGGEFDAGTSDAGVDAGVPPRVLSRAPAAGELAVQVDAGISAVFDQPLDPASVSIGSFTLSSDDGLISGTVNYDDTSRTAIFSPAGLLPEATSFTATVTTAVKSSSGVPLEAPDSWTFTTEVLVPADTTPPSVISLSPDAGATGVPLTAVFTAALSEDVQPSTVNEASVSVLWSRVSDSSGVAGAVTYDPPSRRVTFTPTNALMGSSTYVATLGAGIKDLAGNALSPVSLTFSTEADATPPMLMATTPMGSATVSALTHAVSMTFSEPLDPSTVSAASVTFSSMSADGGVANVPGVVSWDEPSRTVGFTPSAPFESDTLITGALSTSITDLAGNALAGASTFSFNVEARGDAPFVSFAIPPDGARLVPHSAVVKVTFSEDMDATTINATNLVVSGRTSAVTYDAATRTATITPSVYLPAASQVTVTVSNVKDAAGSEIAAPYSWTFRTLGGAVKLSADALPDVRNLAAAEAGASAMALWVASSGTSARIQWARRQGTTWSGGDFVSGATNFDEPTVIALGNRFGAFVPRLTGFSVFDNGSWAPTTGQAPGMVAALGDTAVSLSDVSGAVAAYTLAPNTTAWAGPTTVSATGSLDAVATTSTFVGVAYRVSTTPGCRLGFKRFDGASWSSFEAPIATATSTCGAMQRVRLVSNGSSFAAGFVDSGVAKVARYDVASDQWMVTPLGAAQGAMELATSGTGGLAAFYRTSTHVMVSTWSGSAWSTPTQLDVDPTPIEKTVGWSGGYAALRYGSSGRLIATTFVNGAVTNRELKLAAGGRSPVLLSVAPRSTGFVVTYGLGDDAFLRSFEGGAFSNERKLNGNGPSHAALVVGSRLLSSDNGALLARELLGGTALGPGQSLPPGSIRGNAGVAQPAIRADGAALFAWAQFEAGALSCFVRYFDGASWSPPSKLPVTTVDSPTPERCMAMTNGRVFAVAWIRAEANGYVVYAAPWTADAGLGAPGRVSATSLNASDLLAQSDGSALTLVWSSNAPGRGAGNIVTSSSTDGVSWSPPTNLLTMPTTSVAYEPVHLAASRAGLILSTNAFGSTTKTAVAFGAASGSQNLSSAAAPVAAGHSRLAVLDTTASAATLYVSSSGAFSSTALPTSGLTGALAALGPEFRIAAGGSTYLTAGTTLGAAGMVDDWTVGEVAMQCDPVGCGMFGRHSANFTELRTHYTAGDRLVLLGNVIGNGLFPRLHFAAGRYGLHYATFDANKQAYETWWIWDER